MTAIDFDALEKLAAGMAPGPRCVSHPGLGLNDYPIVVTGAKPTGDSRRIAGVDGLLNTHNNAAAIAAFDRETLLVLIALARRTEEAETSWRALADEHNEACAALGRTDARVESAERERDQARAALTEACDIARWYTGDLGDPDFPASNICKAHAERIAELRKIGAPDTRTASDADRADVQGGGLPVSSFVTCTVCGFAPCDPSSPDHVGARRPLDPAHVEVLRSMAGSVLEAKRLELEGLRERYSKTTRQTEAALEREIAALEAALGEVKP